MNRRSNLPALPPQIKHPRMGHIDNNLKVKLTFKFFSEDTPLYNEKEHSKCKYKVLKFLKNLMDLEGRPWSELEIKTNGRRSDHIWEIPVLENHNKEITEKLSLITEGSALEVDQVYQIRFGNKVRFWGVKINDYFAVIWWDPFHRIYCTKKK